MADVPELLKEDDQSQSDSSDIPQSLKAEPSAPTHPPINININANPQPQADQSQPQDQKGNTDYSDVTGGKTGFQKTMEGLVAEHPWLAGPKGEGVLGQYLPDDQKAQMPSQDGGQVASIGNPLSAVTPPGEAPNSEPVSGNGEMPVQAQAPQQQAPQNPVQSIRQSKANDYLQQIQNYQHDLDQGHIQPETYKSLFDKKDTLGKIGTIFGLMLSGFGSGISRQPNMALDMMNKQIQNDLEAQKANVENKRNFLSLAQQAVMNKYQVNKLNTDQQVEAMTLAQIHATQSAVHDLVRQVNALPVGTPQRQQAEQTLALISQQAQGQIFNAADRAASIHAMIHAFNPYSQTGGEQGQQGPNADPTAADEQRLNFLRVYNPKLAENLEKRLVPGVGVSSVEVPDKIRGELVAREDLQNQVQRLRSWAQQNAGTLNPEKINEGRTLAKLVQDKVRSANGQGVFREAEANFINGIVDQDPTKFFNGFRTDPKYKALMDSNLSTLNTIRKGYGLPQKQDTSGMVRVISPNGQAGSIPEANLQRAIQLGYRTAQ